MPAIGNNGKKSLAYWVISRLRHLLNSLQAVKTKSTHPVELVTATDGFALLDDDLFCLRLFHPTAGLGNDKVVATGPLNCRNYQKL